MTDGFPVVFISIIVGRKRRRGEEAEKYRVDHDDDDGGGVDAGFLNFACMTMDYGIMHV